MEKSHERLHWRETNEIWHRERPCTYLQVLNKSLGICYLTKVGDDVTFWGYVGTKAVSLCVEFCDFVQNT
jgi:hypothetical protein